MARCPERFDLALRHLDVGRQTTGEFGLARSRLARIQQFLIQPKVPTHQLLEIHCAPLYCGIESVRTRSAATSKTLHMTYAELPHDVVDLVILVDDGSKDETAKIARELGLELFTHNRNYGYGANQKTCYHEALKAGADIVVMVFLNRILSQIINVGSIWKMPLPEFLIQ